MSAFLFLQNPTVSKLTYWVLRSGALPQNPTSLLYNEILQAHMIHHSYV